MRIESHHFATALAAALMINVLVLVTFSHSDEGENSKTQGPKIDFDITAGGILGAVVESTVVAEDTVSEDPIPVEEAPTDALKPEATESHMAKVDRSELMESELDPPVEVIEPLPEPLTPAEVLPAVTKPTPPAIRVKSPKTQKKAAVQKKKKVKPRTRKSKPVEKTGKSRKRAKAGSHSSGAAGRGKGGGGRARANAGAISSYKSRVNARMATCVRRRITGRSQGRVVIRFSVGLGGGARGVGVSGTPALRGLAASAARGCSLPAPPRGAGRLRFAFPVTVR